MGENKVWRPPANHGGAAHFRRISQFQRPRWIIYLQQAMSKTHFLQYAARYARRPAIAQSRLLGVTDGEVEFWTKDKKQKRKVKTRYSLQDPNPHQPLLQDRNLAEEF